MDKQKGNSNFFKYFCIGVILLIIFNNVSRFFGSYNNYEYDNEHEYSNDVFKIYASNDNRIIDDDIREYAKKKGYKISIIYADTLDMIENLNSGEKYDAIFVSNSIWLRMLDSNVVRTSSLRSTSITPIIFGIKESKARELGFIDKKVYTNDILKQIKDGKLKFSMANPLTTNSGVSAYLEILTNLSGNPEVLKKEHLENDKLKSELKEFFKGIKRTSGDENFLETSFINGDYDAAFTYESSIININKKLAKQKKETLYAIYPVDGVAISDSPFVYIDNKDENKKEIFDDLQSYLLSESGQKILLENGRRTWYGGISNSAPKDIFNTKWGINTTDYITPIKYPSIAVINEALSLYQSEFRKPIHVVFCLDYSGSMNSGGIDELIKSMEYVLTTKDLSVNFSNKDKIDIVPFSSDVIDVWSSSKLSKEELLEKVREEDVYGATALYDAAIKGIDILSKENSDEYVSSIILMTDGQANIGTFKSFKNRYEKYKLDIPVYSITFGSADESQLLEISNLTNGKIFDGKSNLQLAFKKVRGYN